MYFISRTFIVYTINTIPIGNLFVIRMIQTTRGHPTPEAVPTVIGILSLLVLRAQDRVWHHFQERKWNRYNPCFHY